MTSANGLVFGKKKKLALLPPWVMAFIFPPSKNNNNNKKGGSTDWVGPMVALDAATGEILWEYHCGASVGGEVAHFEFFLIFAPLLSPKERTFGLQRHAPTDLFIFMQKTNAHTPTHNKH